MNIKECHVILDQSQRRISYVHLCKNTKCSYSPPPLVQLLYPLPACTVIIPPPLYSYYTPSPLVQLLYPLPCTVIIPPPLYSYYTPSLVQLLYTPPRLMDKSFISVLHCKRECHGIVESFSSKKKRKKRSRRKWSTVVSQ